MIFRQDGALSVWATGTTWAIDPKNGKVLGKTEIAHGRILAVSPLGDWLAAYDPFQMSIWDARTGQFKQTLEGEASTPFVEYYWEGRAFRQFYAAAFTSDGTRLVTAGAGGVWVYDTKDNRMLQQLEGSNAQKLVLSADGKWMMTSLYDQSQPITVYDVNTGEQIFGFTEAAMQTTQMAFSPSGRWAGALSNAWDAPYELSIVDMSTHQMVKNLPFEKELAVTSLAFHPNDTLAAVGQADGKIFIIDLAEMQVIATLTGHSGQVTQLLFSPDGLSLVSGGADGTVRFWRVP
jgi:WD40 repeat protein